MTSHHSSRPLVSPVRSAVFLLLVSWPFLPSLADESLSFDRDIRPILSDKCFFCHGPDREHREAGLRLDLPEEAAAAIVPGDIEASELIVRILSDDRDTVMPPPDSLKTLTGIERDLLVKWVVRWTVAVAGGPNRQSVLTSMSKVM